MAKRFLEKTHSLPIHKPTNESSRIRAACLGCAVAEPSSIEILNRAIGVDQQSAMPYPITYLLIIWLLFERPKVEVD